MITITTDFSKLEKTRAYIIKLKEEIKQKDIIINELMRRLHERKNNTSN